MATEVPLAGKASFFGAEEAGRTRSQPSIVASAVHSLTSSIHRNHLSFLGPHIIPCQPARRLSTSFSARDKSAPSEDPFRPPFFILFYFYFFALVLIISFRPLAPVRPYNTYIPKLHPRPTRLHREKRHTHAQEQNSRLAFSIDRLIPSRSALTPATEKAF